MIDPRRPDFDDTPVSPRVPRSWYEPADPTAAPAVSIVTPFHSGAEHIHETARSVLGQSLQQWEWILVNDAAPGEQARTVLDHYRNHPDPRIRVVDHEHNRGLPAARNTGFAAARADLIYLLDDDDLIEPTTLEKTLWFLASHPDCAFVNGWSVGFGAETYLWARGFDEGEAFLHDNLVACHVLVRKQVHQAVGGFDETLVHGFEDWDFWLRCASRGLWGATIREYLSWYRRRAHHGDRWANLEGGNRTAAFRRELASRFPTLRAGAFPQSVPCEGALYEPVEEAFPVANRLREGNPRVLLILPWLTLGGADKFNLDLVEHLSRRGFELTIATTLDGDVSWGPHFARYTSDLFHLPGFLRLADAPRFLAYLIESRRPDQVLISNSELGYLLLPWLRARCPDPAYLDYCHMEQEEWKNGGYPRLSVASQSSLDLSLVSSQHLKGWMTTRGADPDRIEVVHTNIDPEHWKRDSAARAQLRAEWEIRDDETVILFAARFCDQKRPLLLVAVLAELARRRVPFRAVIAGDGEQRAAVEHALRSHDLTDRVRMLGAIPTDAMPNVMSASDVFLLPSRWEGIALSLFEAMSMELVAVAADVGGQRELLTPECGVLIPITSDEIEIPAYANALEHLLRDPDALRAMGKQARDRVRSKFPLEAMADAVVSAFDRARSAHAVERPQLPPDFARSWAQQAVDTVALSRVADVLWRERAQLRARISATGQLAPGAENLLSELAAEQWLAHIEASRSWRLVDGLRRTRIYRAWARLRFGRGWDLELVNEDPRRRLARIQASRSYRLIRALKSNPVYGWYARRRYGPSWDQTG